MYSETERCVICMAGLKADSVELVTILWLAQHDPDAATAEAALDLWEDCSCELPRGFLKAILKYLCSPHADIRTAAAEALGFGLQVCGPFNVKNFFTFVAAAICDSGLLMPQQ